MAKCPVCQEEISKEDLLILYIVKPFSSEMRIHLKREEGKQADLGNGGIIKDYVNYCSSWSSGGTWGEVQMIQGNALLKERTSIVDSNI